MTVQAVLLAAVLGWHYKHVLRYLVSVWSTNGDWSHGFIIPFFSLYYLYLQRDRMPRGLPSDGTAGRLVCGKGIESLIEAVAILKNGGVGCRLAIAGDGQDGANMRELAGRLGVLDRVLFAGFVDDMPAFYSALDVFALCSDTESFGLALAEAMACERVVVGTPTAGARRQIDHQSTGWQLRGFAPAELADALAVILGNPARFAPMGTAARQAVAQQFSIDLTLERTLRALRGGAGHRVRLDWPGMNAPPFAAMTAEDLQ